MTQYRASGWIAVAIAVSVLGVGGGWYAAWEVENSARTHWETLATEAAADTTEALAVTLERAERSVFAFARSLPDPGLVEPGTLGLAFSTEAEALRLLGGDPPFYALGWAARVRGDLRPAFEARTGLTIVGPDRSEIGGQREAFVAVETEGGEDALFPGLDLAADPRLAATAADGYRAGGAAVTGPSFAWLDRRLTPVAVRHGSQGVVVGLLDLTELLDTALTLTLPEGLSVRIEERAAGSSDSGLAPIFERGNPGKARLNWETRYAQGGVGWRFAWGAHDDFRDGVSNSLSDGLRIGSIVGTALILAILVFANTARRREDALSQAQSLMHTTVEQMAEGMLVVDPDGTIIGSNAYFRTLYDIPDDLVRSGVPVEGLVRFRLNRGDYGRRDHPDAFLAARLKLFREAQSEIDEEVLKDGRTIEIRRTRTTDGMLMSLYLDATERRRSEADREAATALIETTFDHMNDGLTAIDLAGRLLNWNERFVEIFGIRETDLHAGRSLQKVFEEALTSNDAKTIDAAMRRIGLTPGQSTGPDAGPAETVRLEGDKWVELSHRPMHRRGSVVTYVDVTERMRTNERLRRSEERYALAAAGSNDGLWDWDLQADRLYTSPRWREMLGIGREPVSDRATEWFDRVHPKDAEELEIAVAEHLSGRSEHFQCEFRILHADGAYLWTLARGLAVRDDSGEAVRLTGSLTDMTDRKRAEEKLIRDALYDTVTGLPNRALFLDRIEQKRRHHRDPGDPIFAILFLDLDRFKVINDSLGHDVGDRLLIEVARRLEASVKPGDSVARLAGDEFGILLADVESRDAALDGAHWLQNDMSQAFVLGEQEVFTSVTIGISLPSDDFRDAEEMLRAADIAMYKAKELGQSSTAVFHPTMQSRAITQMQLENDLRRAVDRDEIEMVYQPIVNLATGALAGVEALARWRHPDRGSIVPGDFIPLAEDTGLISRIGTVALRLACRQMKAWERELGDAAPATMSVNLSGRQLQDPDMVREVELLLARAGVDGARLKLEVTESTIMMNPEMTSRLLMDLKELGVALSIDDFGTGYSSLSYLHRFPFDTLKIDRSFVVTMEEKPENMEIIRSITLLAHNLGMDVIAEGIESERHLQHLCNLGCEYGQGYWFSTPLAADKIADYVRTGHRWQVPGAEDTLEDTPLAAG